MHFVAIVTLNDLGGSDLVAFALAGLAADKSGVIKLGDILLLGAPYLPPSLALHLSLVVERCVSDPVLRTPVDDAAVWGMELRDVVNMIKGEEHTSVHLTLRRGDDVYFVDLPRTHSHLPELPRCWHKVTDHAQPPPGGRSLSPGKRSGPPSPRIKSPMLTPRTLISEARREERNLDRGQAAKRQSWQEAMAESWVSLIRYCETLFVFSALCC